MLVGGCSTTSHKNSQERKGGHCGAKKPMDRKNVFEIIVANGSSRPDRQSNVTGEAGSSGFSGGRERSGIRKHAKNAE